MPLVGWLCTARSPLALEVFRDEGDSCRWSSRNVRMNLQRYLKAFESKHCSLLPAVWWPHLYMPLIASFYSIGVPWLTLQEISEEHLGLQKDFFNRRTSKLCAFSPFFAFSPYCCFIFRLTPSDFHSPLLKIVFPFYCCACGILSYYCNLVILFLFLESCTRFYGLKTNLSLGI